MHASNFMKGEKDKKKTYSVISTSQPKSAMEPVVGSIITYMINRQTKPSNSEEFLVKHIP